MEGRNCSETFLLLDTVVVAHENLGMWVVLEEWVGKLTDLQRKI